MLSIIIISSSLNQFASRQTEKKVHITVLDHHITSSIRRSGTRELRQLYFHYWTSRHWAGIYWLMWKINKLRWTRMRKFSIYQLEFLNVNRGLFISPYSSVMQSVSLQICYFGIERMRLNFIEECKKDRKKNRGERKKTCWLNFVILSDKT